jgi:hypothetical protein
MYITTDMHLWSSCVAPARIRPAARLDAHPLTLTEHQLAGPLGLSAGIFWCTAGAYYRALPGRLELQWSGPDED